MLLELGADVNNGAGIFGSLLNIASFKLDKELCEELIFRNINCHKIDEEGNNPLHLVFAVFSKNTPAAKEIASLLLLNSVNPNTKNKFKWTPLHMAFKKD